MNSEKLLNLISEVMRGPKEKALSRLSEIAISVNRLLVENVQSDICCLYQGSVLNNTVVLDYSDVDLLVLSREYCLCDMNRVEWVAEHGGELARLQILARLKNIPVIETSKAIVSSSSLRKECAYILKSTYSNVEINHPKSITIVDNESGLKFDIVIATLFETVESLLNPEDMSLKGVCIYNAQAGTYESVDFPLLNARAVDLQDRVSGGRFRRLVRFLKKVKGDISSNMTSFDVYSICKAIPPEFYSDASDAQLVFHLQKFYKWMLNDEKAMNNIADFTGTTYMFRNNEKRRSEAKEIYSALNSICLRLIEN